MEAKRTEEENERKRFVILFKYLCLYFMFSIHSVSTMRLILVFWDKKFFSFMYRIMALRKAEKEEEKRAREKIRQRLEEDKVMNS